jgi:hypothetical protein
MGVGAASVVMDCVDHMDMDVVRLLRAVGTAMDMDMVMEGMEDGGTEVGVVFRLY